MSGRIHAGKSRTGVGGGALHSQDSYSVVEVFLTKGCPSVVTIGILAYLVIVNCRNHKLGNGNATFTHSLNSGNRSPNDPSQV